MAGKKPKAKARKRPPMPEIPKFLYGHWYWSQHAGERGGWSFLATKDADRVVSGVAGKRTAVSVYAVAGDSDVSEQTTVTMK